MLAKALCFGFAQQGLRNDAQELAWACDGLLAQSVRLRLDLFLESIQKNRANAVVWAELN